MVLRRRLNLICDLFGHRWWQVSYGSKECTRCGLRSGGYWTDGIT